MAILISQYSAIIRLYMISHFHRPWTKEEIEFIRINIGKITYDKMGAHINRSYSAIQSKVRYLPFQKKIKKHAVNFNFFKKWSREMSYVLGFIAADGNICHSGNAHTLHIACDDKDVIEKIKKVLNYSGPIYEKTRPANTKISYSLRICDKTIFADLNKLGITERKSLTLSPVVKPAFITDFLRGYLDGDGTVHVSTGKYPNKLHVIFYTASKRMAKFVHINLKKLLGDYYGSTIRSRITQYNNPYYSISIGHKASSKLYRKLYRKTSIFMDRKRNKFIQSLSI